MIGTYQLEEVVANLQIKPLYHSLLVLVPQASETTESGIIKGEELRKEEEDKLETFLTVVAVSKEIEDIQVGDRVFIQGNITTFNEDMIPPELDIAPEGYTIGLTLEPYVKMKI